MSILTLKVNGRSHEVDVDPSTPLLYVLSDDLELRGPKFGCGLGQCGACTVTINGQATRSCVTPVNAVGQSEVMKIANTVAVGADLNVARPIGNHASGETGRSTWTIG